MDAEERRLEEQAERQRRRAPEPGPEDAVPVVIVNRGYSHRTVEMLLWVPLSILLALAVVIDWRIFVFGLLVLCAVGPLVVTRLLDRRSRAYDARHGGQRRTSD